MFSVIQDPVRFIDVVSAARGDRAPTAADQADSPNVPLAPTLVADAQECGPSFCMTEDALSRIEAALRVQEKRRIPRAGQLSPVPGLRTVESEGSSQNQRPTSLSFEPSPPLAPDRLVSQGAAKRGRFKVRAVLIILIAGALTAALAHNFFTGEMSGEPAGAKVLTIDQASLPAPSLVGAQVAHQTIEEATDQGEDKSKAGTPIEPPVPAPKSASSAASPPNIPAPSLTPHPRMGKPPARARKPSVN
jgi:hypothetical protein